MTSCFHSFSEIRMQVWESYTRCLFLSQVVLGVREDVPQAWRPPTSSCACWMRPCCRPELLDSDCDPGCISSLRPFQMVTLLRIHDSYHHSRSKSSSLSRYFMMFRLILDESTHVTKSSRFLKDVSL